MYDLIRGVQFVGVLNDSIFINIHLSSVVFLELI